MAKKPTYEELENRNQELEQAESEWKQAEKALRESEEKYRGLIEGLDEATYRMSLPDGKYEYMSPAARKVFGHSAEEFIENPLLIRKLIHPDFVEYFEEKWADLIEEKVPPTYKYKILDPEGNERSIVQSNTGIFDDSGNLIAIEGLCRDITKKVRAEEALLESEKKYRTLFDDASEAILVAQNGVFVFTNQKGEELFGYPQEELVSRPLTDFVHEEDREMVRDRHIRRLKGEIFAATYPFRIMCKSGDIKWVELNVALFSWDKKPATLCFMMDITERKHTEEALRESEEKYRGLFDESITAVYLFDKKKNFLDSNQAGLDLLGYPREELLSMSIPDVDADPMVVQPAHEQLLSGDRIINYEHKLRRKDGKVITVLNNSRPLTNDDEQIVGMQSTLIDITERKRAEEEIRRSKILLESSIESPKDMIILSLDREYRYLYFNIAHAESMRHVYGTRPKIGDCIFDHMKNKDDIKKVKEHYDRALSGEGHVAIEEYGEVQLRYYYEIRYNPVYNERNEIIGITSFAQNITERKQAEELLLQKTQDLGERVKELNCLYGISNLVEKPDISLEEIFQGVVDLIPPSWQYPEITCSRIILEDKEYKTENFKETNWKHSGDILVNGERMGLLQICYLEERPEIDEGPFLKEERDLIDAITERLGHIIEWIQTREEKERLEAQLQQATKMEAIATLAGGIAHEFNNALMGVLGTIELLKWDLPEDERRDGHFEAMNESGHRMSRLTDQLLAYAEGGQYEPRDLKLDDFIIEILPILQHDLSPEVRVETHFPKVSYIRADHTQMQMVLSAILANSNEAIEDEGIIKISAENKDIDEAFTKQHPGLKPGSYVCLTIEDNGKGMDEETIDGIFEPFFTTKFQGRGMGMAAVYGIIKSHDGAIIVDSEPGKGTMVCIYLPAISAESREQEKKAVKEPKVEIAMGEGTILVIEDEEPLVDLFRQILERLGYRVLLAETGKQAVELAKTFDGQIDLALLDIKLPDMDGGRVYPLIMEARPDLKVIVCSGYSIHGPAQDIIDAGAEGFIQKPFSLAPFAEKLKEVLEGK